MCLFVSKIEDLRSFMFKIGGRSLKQQKNLATPLLFLRSCSDAYQTSVFIKSQILYFKYINFFNQFQKHQCNFKNQVSAFQYFSSLIGRILWSAVNCYLYSVGPVHLMIGDNRLFTKHISTIFMRIVSVYKNLN